MKNIHEQRVPTERRKEVLFDRSEARVKALERLRGQAWDLRSTGNKSVPEGWGSARLTDGVLIFDPKRIEVNSVHGEDILRGYLDLGWKYFGQTETGANILINPVETELDFKRIEGVEVSLDEEDLCPIIKIGTFVAKTSPVISFEEYCLEGNADDAIEVHIERVLENTQPGDPKARNPQLARLTIMTEMRLLIEQLRAMGYQYIFSNPSDARRSRVYQRMGMQPIGKDHDLYAPIDKLLERTTRK